MVRDNDLIWYCVTGRNTSPQVSLEEGMAQRHVGCMNGIKTWANWRPAHARHDKGNVSLVFMIRLPIKTALITLIFTKSQLSHTLYLSCESIRIHNATYRSVINWQMG